MRIGAEIQRCTVLLDLKILCSCLARKQKKYSVNFVNETGIVTAILNFLDRASKIASTKSLFSMRTYEYRLHQITVFLSREIAELNGAERKETPFRLAFSQQELRSGYFAEDSGRAVAGRHMMIDELTSKSNKTALGICMKVILVDIGLPVTL